MSLTAAGCSQIGPATIANGRFDYNEAIVRSFDNQMLLNLVRLRYQDSILFLDLTSVVASYSREATVGASSGATSDTPNLVRLLALGTSGGVTWTESPTISYAPLQGEDFAKRLLAPIQPSSILLLSRSGWGLERLLLCTVQQLNELPNGTSIGGVAPRKVTHFREFGRVAELLRDLQENGFIQINTLANQPSQSRSRPVRYRWIRSLISERRKSCPCSMSLRRQPNGTCRRACRRPEDEYGSAPVRSGISRLSAQSGARHADRAQRPGRDDVSGAARGSACRAPAARIGP